MTVYVVIEKECDACGGQASVQVRNKAPKADEPSVSTSFCHRRAVVAVEINGDPVETDALRRE